MTIDFRDNLILLFFKESEGSYIIYDLLRLLSISQEYLEDRIDELIEKKLLLVDERLSYQITTSGIGYLSANRFNKVNLFELINEVSNEIEGNNRPNNKNFEDIYIPKNFKNMIYSKKELDGLF
ncbi:hypothetical protein [Planococcus glaciei]|uniref:hypothetical protein n=1 Tax=Planococcus glaciei TaxID=459472 RepID=UPI001C72F4CF|nr:hypothetical protein [Planococcus glaciei]MBX0315491.1 hypothetical protein [Planococcus glaciei]